jgi:hypothetical protein
VTTGAIDRVKRSWLCVGVIHARGRGGREVCRARGQIESGNQPKATVRTEEGSRKDPRPMNNSRNNKSRNARAGTKRRYATPRYVVERVEKERNRQRVIDVSEMASVRVGKARGAVRTTVVSIAIQWRGKITYRKEYVRDLGTLDDPGVVDNGTGDAFDAFDTSVLDEHLDFLGELLGVEPGFCL